MNIKNREYAQYFNNRNIHSLSYSDYQIPHYLAAVLPANKNAKILDIGCGLGQTLLSLKQNGYIDVTGIDVSDEAVSSCQNKGLTVFKTESINNFCLSSSVHYDKYDFIIMSHILEHLEKSAIIETLQLIRQRLLNPGAALMVIVPNAQSNTGCYWAYEDFTHKTLFTTGSLYFVLKSAGYASVEFLDPDGVEGSKPALKWFKKLFLCIYRSRIFFWNFITNSSYHRPSPQIFTYEIKVIAK